MRSSEFWDYFNGARARLALRANGFGDTFAHLDRFDRPVGIVETGCARQKDAWENDGQSTILFDKYAESHPGSVVLSVDKDPAATALCCSLVSSHTRIHTGDSVAFLESLTQNPPPELSTIDLLYLDSFDVDLEDPWPSAAHHLNELLAIMPLLRTDTLVVVDDSPLEFFAVPTENGSLKPISEPRIGGKARMIAEYAATIGAAPQFSGYQCGWVGFRSATANETNWAASRRDNGIAESLIARSELPLAEVRAIMAWIRRHQRLAGVLRRTSRLATGWSRHR